MLIFRFFETPCIVEYIPNLHMHIVTTITITSTKTSVYLNHFERASSLTALGDDHVRCYLMMVYLYNNLVLRCTLCSGLNYKNN